MQISGWQGRERGGERLRAHRIMAKRNQQREELWQISALSWTYGLPYKHAMLG